jgi:hypothetical protein
MRQRTAFFNPLMRNPDSKKPNIMKKLTTSICVIALALASNANAARPFEGVWAQTHAECMDKEGPNTRTLIDLSNKEGGKSLPIFDGYEWHCKVLNVEGNDTKATLRLRCAEFWENLTKGVDVTKSTATLVVKSKQSITIDGEKYIRCKN